MKALEYFYYSIYRFLQRTNAKDVAGYVTCIWLSLLLGINIIVIVGNFNINPLKYMPSRTYGLIVLVPLFILFYFLFLRNKRYLKVVERFANENKRQRITRTIIVLGYVVISIAALILF